MSDCLHDSMSGDEGPVALLGRMPVRWRCDACDAIVYDDVNLYEGGSDTSKGNAAKCFECGGTDCALVGETYAFCDETCRRSFMASLLA